MADEYIDILNDDGSDTGKIALKSEAHKKGLFHRSAHLWLYTSTGKVLVQQRAMNKDTFPGLWDISVAGHITAGETAEITQPNINPSISGKRKKCEDI